MISISIVLNDLLSNMGGMLARRREDVGMDLSEPYRAALQLYREED